jgi:hypothetical protein
MGNYVAKAFYKKSVTNNRSDQEDRRPDMYGTQYKRTQTVTKMMCSARFPQFHDSYLSRRSTRWNKYILKPTDSGFETYSMDSA